MKKKRQEPTSNSFLFVLIISNHFSAFGETIVWGQLSKDVTLPCLFTPGEDETIHWYLADNDNVHSYYNGRDQLAMQDNRYKGRTALFASEVNKGNASLQLHNLQMSDENRYNCYVATKTKKEEFPVTLHVAVFEEQSIESNNIQLKCYVKNFFPNDSISIKWEPNNENINNSDVSESYFTATNTNVAQCFIHHSVLNVTWRGSWEKEELTVTEQSNIKFECKSCKSLKTNFTVTWSFKNDSLELELAALNSSSNILSVIEKYKNRIKRTLGEISLELKDLIKEDTGEYVCIVRSADSMHINVTLLNIIAAEERNSSLWKRIFCVCPVIVIAAAVAVAAAVFGIKYRRKRRKKKTDQRVVFSSIVPDTSDQDPVPSERRDTATSSSLSLHLSLLFQRPSEENSEESESMVL